MVILILGCWSHWIREQLLLTWDIILLIEFYIMQWNQSLRFLHGQYESIFTNYRMGYKYQGLPNEKSNVRNTFPNVVLFSLVQLREIIGTFFKTRSTTNHIHSLSMEYWQDSISIVRPSIPATNASNLHKKASFQTIPSTISALLKDIPLLISTAYHNFNIIFRSVIYIFSTLK